MQVVADDCILRGRSIEMMDLAVVVVTAIIEVTVITVITVIPAAECRGLTLYYMYSVVGLFGTLLLPLPLPLHLQHNFFRMTWEHVLAVTAFLSWMHA